MEVHLTVLNSQPKQEKQKSRKGGAKKLEPQPWPIEENGRDYGLNTHTSALESKETVHGASVHSVIGPIDSGPIICQGRLNIRSNDNPESLGIRVLKIEHMIFPMAVGAVLSGKVRLVDDKWTISNHLNDSWYKADFKENYDFSDCGFSS